MHKRSLFLFVGVLSLIASLLIFVSLYWMAGWAYERSVRESAVESSAAMAEGTFNSMFQVMRQGWNRQQLEEFISSVQQVSERSPYLIDIYRADRVVELFGPIEQKPMDRTVELVVESGLPQQFMAAKDYYRYSFPLLARQECLRCHVNAEVGDVLGVIDVRHDLTRQVQAAQRQLREQMWRFVPIPLLLMVLCFWLFKRQVDRSIRSLEKHIAGVNKVSDLTTLQLKGHAPFSEFDSMMESIGELVDRLKGVAVDKELLEFEIRLLEKFVITSDVVRDWREYVNLLLSDINQVINTYYLFSVFKVDDELFGLEVFWFGQPSDETRQIVTESARHALREHPSFSSGIEIEVVHNLSSRNAEPLSLSRDDIELQTKSLFVETPKIGGIVGIGVQGSFGVDSTRRLVMDSILSTLLNVVGSVKAIYKYTRDLEYYATRDPLTNLYNQRLFWELLDYEIGRAQRHDYRFALLVIDVDNFKTINDTYGHSFGDLFLERFADTVKEVLRKADIFARYGGDEFVLLLPEIDEVTAQAASERVLAAINKLEVIAPSGASVKATVSIGAAIYPEHAMEKKDLFLFADNMMYRAKSHGKNRVHFPDQQEAVAIFRDIGERTLLVSQAIEERRLVPHFQPMMTCADGRVGAVEVLCRIQMPDQVLMTAGEFIEIAEQLGMVHQLDYIVMEKAFAMAREAQYQGLIFINLSPKAMILSEFLPRVKLLAAASGLRPNQLVFEITERETIKNLTLLEQFINDLKLEGFQLAIDDFGSGFSSFHYLKRFPIDFVKIEGEFVANMARSARDAAFVHCICNLAHELGARTVAEFVEDAEVLQMVSAAGITLAQGYHIARPGAELPRYGERMAAAEDLGILNEPQLL